MKALYFFLLSLVLLPYRSQSQNPGVEQSKNADYVVAETSIASRSGESAGIETGHGLIDPIVPPPKWL